jgi:hypothetical protein
MSKRSVAFFAVSALVLAGPALAGSAPQPALDKTVTLSWTTSGTSRRLDGTPFSFSNVNIRTIYISGAGRPFVRISVRSKKHRREFNLAPDDRRRSHVNFQGDKLVGVELFDSGARQYTATFDPAFSSCSLSVIDAKSGGMKIKRWGPDGATYEIDNVSTGSPTCSIQSGNVFSH